MQKRCHTSSHEHRKKAMVAMMMQPMKNADDEITAADDGEAARGHGGYLSH